MAVSETGPARASSRRWVSSRYGARAAGNSTVPDGGARQIRWVSWVGGVDSTVSSSSWSFSSCGNRVNELQVLPWQLASENSSIKGRWERKVFILSDSLTVDEHLQRVIGGDCWDSELGDDILWQFGTAEGATTTCAQMVFIQVLHRASCVDKRVIGAWIVAEMYKTTKIVSDTGLARRGAARVDMLAQARRAHESST